MWQQIVLGWILRRGPMLWGDGIVNVQDLIVLAEHLFEEVP
jgi:hypothetical protein